MNSNLTNQVVLVTGATGGIGSAIARQFAAEGARLILHTRTKPKEAATLAKNLHPAESLVTRADLTSDAQVKRLFAAALKKFGRIDVLIANAASWETRDTPLHEMTLAQWRHTHDNVLTSTFLTVREFLRVVAKQKRGNAVLISSTAAIFGEAGHADYASAKSAIAYGLTRSLKNEIARLAPHSADYCGGRLNCICPGWTVVPRNQSKLTNPAVVRQVTATMALPQIGRPEDIAHAAVFLASDTLARHLTGQILPIAGGMEGRQLWQPHEINPAII